VKTPHGTQGKHDNKTQNKADQDAQKTELQAGDGAKNHTPRVYRRQMKARQKSVIERIEKRRTDKCKRAGRNTGGKQQLSSNGKIK
jgi:hypothetical protein